MYRNVLPLLLVYGLKSVFVGGGPTVHVTVKSRPNECDRGAGIGDTVFLETEGYLKSGKQFGSSRRRGFPDIITIGEVNRLQGLNYGVRGMCIGEKRRIVVPSEVGFGFYGDPTVGIYGPETLIFETEMLFIKYGRRSRGRSHAAMLRPTLWLKAIILCIYMLMVCQHIGKPFVLHHISGGRFPMDATKPMQNLCALARS